MLTSIILSSSLTMFWADSSEQRGRLGMMRLGLAVSILLALTFLGLQGFEYYRSEFRPDTNAYGSLFFTITGAHGVHYAMAALMAAWVLVRSWSISPGRERISAMGNVSWYWHFVGLVWLAIFGVVYLAVNCFQLGQIPLP